jgi:transposase
MPNKNKAQTYPSEFKESSVKLALESKQSIAQTARDLGIKVNTLYTWIDKYSKIKGSVTRNDEHIYDEVRRLKKELSKVTQERDLLKKELSKVTQERDLLKKVAAYFAKDS